MFHLAAQTSSCALGDEFLFSTFMRSLHVLTFWGKKTGGGVHGQAPSRYHHYHHKWFAIFIIHFLVKMLMPKIHSARRRCIMLFLANTWPLWTYCSNQELMWSVWTSAVTRHCTMLLEWTVKPLWWWAFKQPSSQGIHSLLLREKSWEPVCFLYFLNTRTFSLTVSLLYKHLRIILGKLWKSSGNERKHLC